MRSPRSARRTGRCGRPSASADSTPASRSTSRRRRSRSCASRGSSSKCPCSREPTSSRSIAASGTSKARRGRASARQRGHRRPPRRILPRPQGRLRGRRLELESLERTDRYRIESITIVSPDRVDVLAPTAVPTLTLVTCYPVLLRRQRAEALHRARGAGPTRRPEGRRKEDAGALDPGRGDVHPSDCDLVLPQRLRNFFEGGGSE